tara:strand:+ start:284 stop:490 length:207 start_codon:yes stop_codon:yes gene_type:complete
MFYEKVLEHLLQKHLEKVKYNLNELDVALGNIASGSVDAAAEFSRLDNSFSVLLVPVRPLEFPLLDIT